MRREALGSEVDAVGCLELDLKGSYILSASALVAIEAFQPAAMW